VGKLSSKFERRTVFRFGVNGEHGSDGRTGGHDVTRNAASYGGWPGWHIKRSHARSSVKSKERKSLSHFVYHTFCLLQIRLIVIDSLLAACSLYKYEVTVDIITTREPQCIGMKPFFVCDLTSLMLSSFITPEGSKISHKNTKIHKITHTKYDTKLHISTHIHTIKKH